MVTSLETIKHCWLAEHFPRQELGLITMCMATLSRWLEMELSKHRLELTP